MRRTAGLKRQAEKHAAVVLAKLRLWSHVQTYQGAQVIEASLVLRCLERAYLKGYASCARQRRKTVTPITPSI